MSKRTAVLALCALAAACSYGAFGHGEGQYESLEAEAAAQSEYLTGLLDTAVPEHEVVSTRVNVGPCEPIGGWKVGTSLVVTTGDLHPSAALEQIIDVLEDNGATVESWVDSSDWFGVDYAADQGLFGGRLTLLWSTKPVTAIEMTQPGACYSDDRVASPDPHDIERLDGFILVYRGR